MEKKTHFIQEHEVKEIQKFQKPKREIPPKKKVLRDKKFKKIKILTKNKKKKKIKMIQNNTYHQILLI